MRKTLFAISIILILFALTFIFPDNRDDSKQVRIGVIAGTTGQYAPAGEGYLKGFNLALEQWNNSNQLKFDATIEDDGFNAQKGLSAYKKLNSSNGIDVYAVLSSFTIDAIYEQIQKEDKPVILGFEQSKPAEDDNIFQVLPAAKPVQFALGKKLKESGYKTPAVLVSNNTPVYQNFFEGFKDGYDGNIMKFDIGSDITGIRSQALSIISKKPDVIVFFMAPKDGAVMVKEILKITDSKDRPYLAFDQSIQSGRADYNNILGLDLPQLDGSLVSMSKNEFTSDFISKYRSKYNEEPPFGSDMGYNSFVLLSQTYSPNPREWIERIKNAKITGADGVVSFDENGLRIPNVFFAKLTNGDITK